MRSRSNSAMAPRMCNCMQVVQSCFRFRPSRSIRAAHDDVESAPLGVLAHRVEGWTRAGHVDQRFPRPTCDASIDGNRCHRFLRVERSVFTTVLRYAAGMEDPQEPLRRCLRDPIPEIADAAQHLDDAVSAHLAGRFALAKELIRAADMNEIRQWTESVWGKNSPYVKVRASTMPRIHSTGVARRRHPDAANRALLHQRDGYHCRFCGIPVIRAEVRKRMNARYPGAALWGRRNRECHAAFQAMWAQYDHVVPFTLGGDTQTDNLIVTCAPCNFGRMEHSLDQVRLIDPHTREPVRSPWDGLERFPAASTG
jgi:5-methylcytosine-specific restriction endonuclease McrA